MLASLRMLKDSWSNIMHDKLDVLPVDVKVEIFKESHFSPNNGFTCNKKKNSNKKMAFMED